jgi:2-keto-4-pentenoate hydratase/2-oxohepta-3-ene-1,7-dioic acid hydratase in catechol pathway
MNSIIFENTKVEVSKVVCIGRNYVEHIKELNNEMPSSMILFAKPGSAIGDSLKFIDESCRFEGEISFLIADKKIKGVGFGFDLTKADIQNYLKESGHPWERAKAFDNSAIFSEFVAYEGDGRDLEMKLYKNGEMIQYANYELMIHKPVEIIKEIESFMTLQDNDIVMSGTPKGVGNYKKGDIFLSQIFKNQKLIIEKEFIVG